MDLSLVQIGRILTRTSGYLHDVTSHSLQPYAGCALGNSLCGIGCYVQHNWYITHGRPWGSFVEARENATTAYLAEYDSERTWARKHRGRFGIFLSSSTEPFQPAEQKYRITRQLIEAMIEKPPDLLIVQSHSHHVADYMDLYRSLAERAELRFHISIESDRDDLPDLPRSASPVAKRFDACATLKGAGMKVIVTVSPLLPINDPESFFRRIAQVADAAVIDHFIGGDGTEQGTRTKRTRLPQAMEAAVAGSTSLAYREQIINVAKQYLPVGVGISGFAGNYSH